jgi:hypothetical protein
MKVKLPGTAFILPTLNDHNSGVDFLGLRQANLDMMADAIPSINNVTFYIRPFSLLAWIYWKFYALCRDSGLEETDSEKLKEFRERIEILFPWGARQSSQEYRRIPGTSPAPPATGRATVPLTFDAWGRKKDSTSLIAALWYGPGSKTVTGLGFIAPHPEKANFFRTTDYAGLPLAKALDAQLQKFDRYHQLLATLKTVEASAEDAKELWEYWRPDDITDGEQAAFAAALFDGKHVGDQTSLLGKRSSTLALARFHLEQAGKALTVDDIRRGMFLVATPDGEAYEVPEDLTDAHKKWQVLQMRQLQRYAMEALLSWCEMQILHERVHEPSVLAQSLETEWRDSSIFRPQAYAFSDLLEDLEARFESPSDLLEACRQGELETPFGIMKNIQTHFQRGDTALAPWCLYGLLICSVFAGLHQDAAEKLEVGGATRVSLKSLSERLNRIRSQPLQHALRYILEAMIISQHFATAVNRFDGQNQRLRMAIEETGIEPLVGEPWTPKITEDRLATLLSLAHEAGIVNRTGSSTFETVSV